VANRLSLDIVIPVYNEEHHLAAFLQSLREAATALETFLQPETPDLHFFVVDGGSSDRSVSIAEEYGFPVYSAPIRGRGTQIAFGIEKGDSSWIAILHADSILAADGLIQLFHALDKKQHAVWGIFGHSYSNAANRFRWVSISNWLRFTVFGIAFGDQGIFVERKILLSVGGMPAYRLMEDVELSLRLRRAGERIQLDGPLTVSTRRWERKGSLRYTVQVLSLVGRYLALRRFGHDMQQVSDSMYGEYYGAA
jgi:glycosyltransferase involved in cell wall biosynthesis